MRASATVSWRAALLALPSDVLNSHALLNKYPIKIQLRLLDINPQHETTQSSPMAHVAKTGGGIAPKFFRRSDRTKTHAHEDQSAPSASDNGSIISGSTESAPRDSWAYLAWFEAHNGPQERSWPALVGDCVQRAVAIIRYASPFYTVVVRFKEPYEYGEVDPLRVVLYLDENGYVAHTPVVG